MSGRRLGGIFAIAVLAMLALLWPLRLVLGAVDLQAQRLSAAEVTGTLWSGTLRDANWRGTSLGDVAVQLRPLSSVTGVHRVRLHSDSASVIVLRGRTRGVEALHGELPAMRITSMPGLELQLSFADATLTFAGGRCQEAAGEMQAEVHLLGAADKLAPIVLQGDLACENLTGVVALVATANRAPGTPDIEATLQIEADGSYRLQSQVQATDDATRLMLQAAGFQDSPAGLSRVDSGSLLD